MITHLLKSWRVDFAGEVPGRIYIVFYFKYQISLLSGGAIILILQCITLIYASVYSVFL